MYLIIAVYILLAKFFFLAKCRADTSSVNKHAHYQCYYQVDQFQMATIVVHTHVSKTISEGVLPFSVYILRDCSSIFLHLRHEFICDSFFQFK